MMGASPHLSVGGARSSDRAPSFERLTTAPYPNDLPACRQVELDRSGKLLLAVWGDHVEVRHAASGGRVVDALSVAEGLLAARFSPDGETILLGTRDNRALLLDWRRSRILARTPRLLDTLDEVRWLEGAGPRFVGASRSNELMLFDGETLEPIRVLLGPQGRFEDLAGLAVSPDGRRVFLVSGERLRCFAPETGELLWSCPLGVPARDVAVSADGRWLALASPAEVLTIDAERGEPGPRAGCFRHQGIQLPRLLDAPLSWSPRPAFSPDDSRLAVVTPTGQLMLLAWPSLEVLSEPPRRSVAWIEDLAWFADGDRLLVGCSHDRLVVWSVAGERSLVELSLSEPSAPRP